MNKYIVSEEELKVNCLLHTRLVEMQGSGTHVIITAHTAYKEDTIGELVDRLGKNIQSRQLAMVGEVTIEKIELRIEQGENK